MWGSHVAHTSVRVEEKCWWHSTMGSSIRETRETDGGATCMRCFELMCACAVDPLVVESLRKKGSSLVRSDSEQLRTTTQRLFRPP